MLSNDEKQIAKQRGKIIGLSLDYDKFISLYFDHDHRTIHEALDDYIEAYYPLTEVSRVLDFDELDDFSNIVFLSALNAAKNDLPEIQVFINEKL